MCYGRVPRTRKAPAGRPAAAPAVEETSAPRPSAIVRRASPAPPRMAEDEPRGILCTLTPWKAALVGPFVDYVGLATILPLLPFFLLDLYKQIDSTACPAGSRGVSYPDLAAAQLACTNQTDCFGVYTDSCDDSTTFQLCNAKETDWDVAADSCVYRKGEDASWLGFVLSTQYFGVVVGSIFWGLVADYCGLRAVYLVLLFSDTILFFLSGLCESVLTLCLVRAGAGFCAIMPLGTAWVSATAPPDKQMIAFTFLFISIIGGFVTGSASGGLFAQIDSGVGLSGPNSGGKIVMLSPICLLSVSLIQEVSLFQTAAGSPPRPRPASSASPHSSSSSWAPQLHQRRQAWRRQRASRRVSRTPSPPWSSSHAASRLFCARTRRGLSRSS